MLRGIAFGLAFRWLAPARQFVIVSIGRTGSELLVSLLDSHPLIRCDGEILYTRRMMPTAYVLRRSATAKSRGAQAYGFKLLAHHAGLQDLGDPVGYLRRFRDRGFRLIVLERRDWLQQALSSLRAEKTQHHFRAADRPVFAPLRVDPMAVIAALFMIEDSVNFIRSALADIPRLDLVYEEDLAEREAHQKTTDRACEYLDLPPAPVESDLIKHTPRSTAEQVENYDELVDALSGTRYARFLDEP